MSYNKKPAINADFLVSKFEFYFNKTMVQSWTSGGEGGIRTLETRKGLTP